MIPPVGSAGNEPASFHTRPLVVDLDGTLVRSDLLIETAFLPRLGRPSSWFEMLGTLLRGKAALKHRLAVSANFDPSVLPYDQAVLASIRQASDEGRPAYLASASNQRLVEAVARHLGIFAGWFASDETNNLSGKEKARRLVAEFGERGFDYIGNEAADLPVWAQAAKAITIRTPASVMRRLKQSSIDVESLPCDRPDWRAWTRLFRVHQYAKNILLFVPLFTAHQFAALPALQALLAAAAFSLCASSSYILNDLLDLAADRNHPSKRTRPLASGVIPLMHGVVAMVLLVIAAIAIAIIVSLPFLSVLLGYLVLSTAYSFWLKRKMLVDVATLAILYTVRIVAGAVAIGVAMSEWLLAFSMFIFMSLALIKRYVELAVRLNSNLSDPSNRNYKVGDLDIIAALAAAAGFNAVVVFTLYISSNTVRELYSRPQLLWLVCPILLYWIARTLMMAHRRLMDDDPIIFALRDNVSRLAIIVIGVIVLAAI